MPSMDSCWWILVQTNSTDAGKQDVEVFRINQGEGQKVVVKSDTRTTVLFNSIPNGEYGVRYAGFSHYRWYRCG